MNGAANTSAFAVGETPSVGNFALGQGLKL
jgi:hypothetical protein